MARYTGENVIVASEEVLGVCKRLNSVRALQEDHVLDILMGLSVCSNSRFRATFEHLKQSAELDNLTVLKSIDPLSSPMDKIEAILEKAVDMYDNLSMAQLWIKPSKHGGNALQSIIQAVNKCWNCGETGHGVGQCKKPKDQARIEKNRKAFQDAKRANSNNNNSNGGGSSGSGNPNPGAGTGARNDKERKLWEAAGIQMVNGSILVHCKRCGLNGTHSTGSHKEWAKNPSGFSLPDSHPYKQALVAHGSDPPSSVGTGGTGASTMSSMGTGMLSVTDVEHRLAEFERTSTDPNASAITEMLRSLLLK